MRGLLIAVAVMAVWAAADGARVSMRASASGGDGFEDRQLDAAYSALMTDLEAESQVAADVEAETTWDTADWKYVHNLIVWLANGLMSSRAKRESQNLVGDITQLGGWADSLKTNPAMAWAADLHFANPAVPCTYEPARDCKNTKGMAGYCADGGIQNYTMRLANPFMAWPDKAEALKFLLHLIADIHSPLHCGSATDLGGNTLKGVFITGLPVTLHNVWDGVMVKMRIDTDFAGNFTTYRQMLLNRIRVGRWRAESSKWTQCARDVDFGQCSDQWARESAKIACQFAYLLPDGQSRVPNGFKLDVSYYERNYPVVERQIAKAAVRLANVLSQIWPDVDVPNPKIKWTTKLPGGVAWVAGDLTERKKKLPLPPSFTGPRPW